jgi:hypothetical protein
MAPSYRGFETRSARLRRILIPAALLILFTLPGVPGCGRHKGLELTVPSVSRTLLTDKPITVGDPIDVALIIYHEKNSEVTYPKSPESFLPFTLRETLAKQKKIKGGISRTMVVYTFTIFRTGSYRLEPLEVAVGGTSLKTEPLQINVLSVLPQDDVNPPLMDIVSPYRARVRTMTVIFIAGAIAGAGALILFLMRFLRLKRRVKAESIQAESEVDPYLYSIRELEILKRESAANTADIKEAYSKLSFVLRFFIGRVLGLNALQMTTREIGRRLKRAQAPHAAELPAGIAAEEGAAAMPGDAPRRPWSWSSRASPRVMDLLKRSDMVKFAKEKPGQQNLGADIDEAQRIVEEVNRSRRGADGMEAAETSTGTSMGGA